MDKEKRGVLITFSVRAEKFKSPSERTVFFRKLYGWRQVVPSEGKTYEYERPGILNEVPHQKVDQSSFIIPEDRVGEIMKFFDEWHNKVMTRSFKVFLDEEMESFFDEMEKNMEEDFNDRTEDLRWLRKKRFA